MIARARRSRALAGLTALALACEPKPPATPRLVVESGAQHLEDVEHGAPLRYELRLANRGTAPLALRGVESAYGCTGEIARPTLAPNEATTLRIRCESQTYGRFEANVAVRSNAPESVKLHLTATIEPLLAFESPTLDLATRFGADVTREMPIIGSRAKTATLTLVPPEPSEVRAELVAATKDAPPKLRLRLSGKMTGTRVGQVTLKTDLPKQAEIALHYGTKVTGTLTVDPTNPYLNLRIDEGRRVTIRVSSTQEDFRVTAAKIAEGPFTADVVPSPSTPGAFEIRVSVDVPRVDKSSTGVSGRLVIVSNDASEPKREMPLFAMGRLGVGDPH